MQNSNQETQDVPAEQPNRLRMALVESPSNIGTVDNQNIIVENDQVKWWAIAVPVLALIVIVATHFLNTPVATKAEGEEYRRDDSASPKASTSSRRSSRKSPNKTFVSGIVYSESKALAFINDEMIPEGGVVNGVTVLKIHEDAVEFEKNGKKWTQKVGE